MKRSVSIIFYSNYYDIVNCCQNVNFKEMGTAHATENFDYRDFDYREEHLMSIPIKILLWHC